MARKTERRGDIMRLRKCLGVAALLVGILCVISGCDFGGGEHEHTFNKWSVTKQPGCVDVGVQSRECEECGYVETGELAAVGHTTVRDAYVKATCTTDGLTEGSHCGVCGETLQAQEAIPAFGHMPLKDYPVEPTCTAEGLTEGSHCALCGVTIVEQTPVAPTGHKYENVTVVIPANCQNPGTKRYSCIWCDISYTDMYTTTEHTIVDDPAVEPTCTESGLTAGTHCSVCNLVFKPQEFVAAKGHSPVNDAHVAPTCTEAGSENGIHCGACNEILQEATVLPALGHQNVEEIVEEATCLGAGLKQFTCSLCGHIEQEPYELPQYTETDIYSAAAEFIGQIITYDRNGKAYAEGVCFVLTSNGMIVTNYTTIVGAYSAEIILNQVPYPVESVLAYDAARDLAVLQVDVEGLIPAQICTKPLTDGQTVYAVGPAKGLSNTYTQGVILVASKEVDGVVYVHHDAAVTAANAGGPLMNVYGEVVGISSLNASVTNGMQLSVFATELDKLVFGEPVTLAQLYEQTTSPRQRIIDMILANGTTDGLGNVVLYAHQIDSDGIAIYELGYEPETQQLFVELSNTSSGNKILTRIYLTEDPAQLRYTCQFSNGSKVYNTMYGLLDAGSYTANSSLTYVSSEGMEGQEEVLTLMYKPYMNKTLVWLDDYLNENLGITIAELGFAKFNS